MAVDHDVWSAIESTLVSSLPTGFPNRLLGVHMPGTAAGAPLRSSGRAFVVRGRAAGRVPSRPAAAAGAAFRHRPPPPSWPALL